MCVGGGRVGEIPGLLVFLARRGGGRGGGGGTCEEGRPRRHPTTSAAVSTRSPSATHGSCTRAPRTAAAAWCGRWPRRPRPIGLACVRAWGPRVARRVADRETEKLLLLLLFPCPRRPLRPPLPASPTRALGSWRRPPPPRRCAPWRLSRRAAGRGALSVVLGTGQERERAGGGAHRTLHAPVGGQRGRAGGLSGGPNGARTRSSSQGSLRQCGRPRVLVYKKGGMRRSKKANLSARASFEWTRAVGQRTGRGGGGPEAGGAVALSCEEARRPAPRPSALHNNPNPSSTTPHTPSKFFGFPTSSPRSRRAHTNRRRPPSSSSPFFCSFLHRARTYRALDTAPERLRTEGDSAALCRQGASPSVPHTDTTRGFFSLERERERGKRVNFLPTDTPPALSLSLSLCDWIARRPAGSRRARCCCTSASRFARRAAEGARAAARPVRQGESEKLV
jgi:hypothetical protein